MERQCMFSQIHRDIEGYNRDHIIKPTQITFSSFGKIYLIIRNLKKGNANIFKCINEISICVYCTE